MAEVCKKLEELNLLDNFLFGSVVAHPDYGEPFSRYLLRVVLNRDVGRLKVVPQGVFFGSDVTLHGATLDVYLEDQEEDATVYDVEPEKDEHKEAVAAIPKRMRFYRAKLDGRGLRAGEDYGKLKKLVMIMITPFDPLGGGRMVYTVRNICVEDPSIPYDDGATMIFLNTKGKPGNASEELRQLLRYVENSTLENAVSRELRELHGMVEHVRHDEEVAIRYMRLWEEEERIRRKALEEFEEKGRKELEKERERADAAEKRAEEAEKEIERLKRELTHS